MIIPLLLPLQHFTLNFKKNREVVIAVSAVCTWDVRGSSISKKERESKRWQRNSENRRRELPPEKMGFRPISAVCHVSGDGEGVGLTALWPFFFFMSELQRHLFTRELQHRSVASSPAPGVLWLVSS